MARRTREGPKQGKGKHEEEGREEGEREAGLGGSTPRLRTPKGGGEGGGLQRRYGEGRERKGNANREGMGVSRGRKWMVSDGGGSPGIRAEVGFDDDGCGVVS
ncbi:hypothetical protein SOVF_090690 [Spinacia oleracea]|nr:hypothetical protein SOVF_090690 [Spinacia oleracea]